MDNIKKEKKKENILVEILLSPVYIIGYFFYGIKALLYDAIILLIKENNKKEYSENQINDLEKKKEQLQIKLQQEKNTDTKYHIYKYIAKNKDNKFISGTILGKNLHDINAYLTNDDLEVYDIKTSFIIDAFYKDTNIGGSKISNKNLVFWLTQLSTYLKAGMTLTDSVKITSKQMKVSKSQQQALHALNYELTLGESFSKVLEKQKKVFPSLVINMIKAAEKAGNLEETLDDLAKYYTDIERNKKEVISAVSYPLIILIFSVVVVFFVMIYVVPQFEKIYASSETEMPALTNTLITISHYLKSHALTIIGMLFAVIIIIVLLYKTNKEARKFFQIILMHTPIIRKIIIYNELYIFSKTFASLLKNNVYITDTIELLSNITKNEVYKEIFSETINNIVKGEKISDAFKNHWAIPDVSYFMMVTGEETGELETMMIKTSEYFENEHKTIINNMKTFLEPALITILAVIVGLIVISVIIPMFDIYGTIR